MIINGDSTTSVIDFFDHISRITEEGRVERVPVFLVLKVWRIEILTYDMEMQLSHRRNLHEQFRGKSNSRGVLSFSNNIRILKLPYGNPCERLESIPLSEIFPEILIRQNAFSSPMVDAPFEHQIFYPDRKVWLISEHVFLPALIIRHLN